MSIETAPLTSPWLTVSESAAYARKSKNTISNALRAQTLRGSQTKEGGTWLVHRDDLDAWLRGDVSEVRVPAVSRRRSQPKDAA